MLVVYLLSVDVVAGGSYADYAFGGEGSVLDWPSVELYVCCECVTAECEEAYLVSEAVDYCTVIDYGWCV